MPHRVAVVAHTHWDREWYLPFETYRARLVEMLDELIPRLASEDSPFLLDGQVAVVDDYLELRPSMERELAELVERGLLSIGPWYVLPDEFLVSGETLWRNLELGMSRAADFGGAMPVGYLPDMFGHIAQMPQLLARFGFTDAVVWRGVPAAVDRTAFRWCAPDGSQVRAEYLPRGYGNGARLPADPELAVDLIAEFEAAHADMLMGDILWMHGGDHQAPTPDLRDRVAEINRAAHGYELVTTSLAEHLAAAPASDLATWRGELRSGARANLLMGVVSNRVDIRAAAGEVEFLLERVVEPVVALLDDRTEWPHEQLDRAWRRLILNSAHDSICGCSLDEVCAAVMGRYAEARQIASSVLQASLERFESRLGAAGEVIANPSRLARRGFVEVLVAEGEPGPASSQTLEQIPGRSTSADLTCAALPETVQRELDIFRNTSDVTVDTNAPTVVVVIHAEAAGTFAPGQVLSRLRALAAAEPDRPAQVTTLTRPARLVLAATPRVPSYGWAPLAELSSSDPEVNVDDRGLDNGAVQVEVDTRTGSFSINGHTGLGRLADGGDIGDTYNYCPPSGEAHVESATVSDVRILEDGPLRGRLQVESEIAGLAVKTTLELCSGDEFVRYQVQFENSRRDHRLRVHHTLPSPAHQSLAGCAFAAVRRGLTAEGGPTEAALPTFPARDFVTAGGLTLAAKGSFEYELVEIAGDETAHAVAVTLVRSTGWLSRGPMPSRPLPAGPEIPLDGAQVQRTVTADHVLAVDCADPFELHERAFSPLFVLDGSGSGPLPASGSAAATTGAVVSAVRISDGELEVRAFNPSDDPTVFEFGSAKVPLGPGEIRTLSLPLTDLGE